MCCGLGMVFYKHILFNLQWTINLLFLQTECKIEVRRLDLDPMVKNDLDRIRKQLAPQLTEVVQEVHVMSYFSASLDKYGKILWLTMPGL